MASLIIHPDVAGTRARIEALREELQAVFDERIWLNFELFPSLRDRYGELFGDLERLLQERTLEMSERRRMVELFSLKLDRGQKLDRKMVELVMKAVRNEFARVRSRMQAAFSAERRKNLEESWRPSPFVEIQGEPETGGGRKRAEEIREIYRALAKRLHPDARAVAGSAARHYWDLVQRGYQRHDLPLLRTLAHLVETLGDAERFADPAMEIERLRAALRAERAQVDAMKRDELYQMREGLDDGRWVASRRALLQDEVAELDMEIAKCDRFLAPILSGEKAPPPEIVQSIWSNFVEDMYINNR